MNRNALAWSLVWAYIVDTERSAQTPIASKILDTLRQQQADNSLSPLGGLVIYERHRRNLSIGRIVSYVQSKVPDYDGVNIGHTGWYYFETRPQNMAGPGSIYQLARAFDWDQDWLRVINQEPVVERPPEILRLLQVVRHLPADQIEIVATFAQSLRGEVALGSLKS